MKKFLLLILLLIGVGFNSSCATLGSNQTPAVKAEVVTLESVYATGAILDSTPRICDALYNAGTISKDAYNNQILPIYNKALASYKLMVNAAKASIALQKNPADSQAYTLALAQFMLDKDNLGNILIANGVDPAQLSQPIK